MDDKTKDPVTPTPSSDDKGANGGNGEPTPKTFTQEEHQAALDRIAAKTRDEEKAKSIKAVEKAREEARLEAERLAKLSEDEKKKELEQKTQKEFEQREKDITLRENKATAIEKLVELKLPTKLVDFVVDLDLTKQDDKIAQLKEAYDLSVKEAVAQVTKGKAPTDFNPTNSNGGPAEAKTQF